MLTVWGRANSINVQKVLWTIGELGLAHERVPLGGSFGGTADKSYLAMNPNGLVPTVRDGDAVLWESNAIVRYLAAKHDTGGLWPEDPLARARADRWMDWSATTLSPAMTPVFMATVRAPRGTARPAGFDAAAEKLASVFRMVEEGLSEADHIAGPRLTIGDIPIGASVARYMRMPIDRPTLPRTEAYYARLQERPAFRTHIMIPFGTCQEEWDALEKQYG
ncbi:glutathione S-transferase family protein [Rhodoligotrophos defluvii]|uniref:glutathione S-transferase family protein n=1 Tax=Rhodoligotrophos defluvii TaxID=2561934 RepID=UPI0010C96E58|nr:glutathione S-transferase family protein [Rhodoligotrophos defluvii]